VKRAHASLVGPLGAPEERLAGSHDFARDGLRGDYLPGLRVEGLEPRVSAFVVGVPDLDEDAPEGSPGLLGQQTQA
jgi:hypothetical protein